MCKKQLNLHTLHQPGLLFTLLWAKKGILPCKGGEEQPGTSKNDEESSSCREPSLQAPFTHPECTSHPSHHLWPLCKLLVQRDPVVWSLWVTLVSARAPRVLLPIHSPFHQQNQDFSYGKAKGKAKQKRFLLIISLVLTKLLNQPFGIKWAKVFAYKSTYAHTGVLTFKHVHKCVTYSF